MRRCPQYFKQRRRNGLRTAASCGSNADALAWNGERDCEGEASGARATALRATRAQSRVAGNAIAGRVEEFDVDVERVVRHGKIVIGGWRLATALPTDYLPFTTHYSLLTTDQLPLTTYH